MWALAAALAPTFAVTYVAGTDCPTQATFEAAVLARAPHAHRAEGDVDVRFEAVLEEPRRLGIRLRSGSSEEREIVADGCVEAMQSMALIAAMVLEAEATNAAAPEPEPPPVVEAAAAPPPPAPVEPASAAAARPVTPPTWLAVGLDGVIEGAAAPSPAFGGAAFVELGRVTRSWLAPSVRLSALFARADSDETNAGSARFSLLLARAHLCGLRAGSLASSVRLCAVVDGGALRGTGQGALNSRAQTMPWLAGGLGALGTVSMSRALSLELGATARALAKHDEFVFAPATRVHQVPVLAWDFSVGLGYRLW